MQAKTAFARCLALLAAPGTAYADQSHHGRDNNSDAVGAYAGSAKGVTLRLAVLGICCIALAGHALADSAPPLPAAIAETHAGDSTGNYGGDAHNGEIPQHSFYSHLTNPAVGSGSASAIMSSHGPIVAVEASGYATSAASIIYFLRINGPEDVLVPVKVQDFFSVGIVGPEAPTWSVRAEARVYDRFSGETFLFDGLSIGTLGGFGYTGSGGSTTIRLPANHVIGVSISAVAYPDSMELTMIAAATADPYFEIPSAFAGDYSLEFSAGVINAPLSPVPEMAPVRLFLLGVGLFILATVHRRRGPARL